MRLFSYVMLLFCLSIGIYIIGIPTGMTALLGMNTGIVTPSEFIASMLGSFLEPANLILLLGVAVAAAFITGFSAVYVIPALIFISVMNLVIMPISVFLPIGCAPNLALCDSFWLPLWVALMNILLLATIWEFVRGGG